LTACRLYRVRLAAQNRDDVAFEPLLHQIEGIHDRANPRDAASLGLPCWLAEALAEAASRAMTDAVLSASRHINGLERRWQLPT
jgi:hypothetical protein